MLFSQAANSPKLAASEYFYRLPIALPLLLSPKFFCYRLNLVFFFLIFVVEPWYGWQIFNRPSVAGAVLQTHSSFIDSLTPSLSQWSFVKISSKHLYSQTIKAREPHLSHDMCHMSCVTCHVSRVTCQVSHVTCHMSLR